MKKILFFLILIFTISIPAYAKEKLPILLYHNITVSEPTADLDLHISKSNFIKHLEYLKNSGYTTITFKDYYSHRVYGTSLPEKPIIITFDDGYKSNYEIAYPLLKEYGFCATIFTVTNSSYQPFSTIYPHFNWEEANEMQKSGIIDIESHSANHSLHDFLSASDIIYNTKKSYYDICVNLRKVPFTYAYPSGKFSLLSQFLVADMGYKIQVIVGGKINDSSTPLNMLSRLNISGNTNLKELLN